MKDFLTPRHLRQPNRLFNEWHTLVTNKDLPKSQEHNGNAILRSLKHPHDRTVCSYRLIQMFVFSSTESGKQVIYYCPHEYPKTLWKAVNDNFGAPLNSCRLYAKNGYPTKLRVRFCGKIQILIFESNKRFCVVWANPKTDVQSIKSALWMDSSDYIVQIRIFEITHYWQPFFRIKTVHNSYRIAWH